VSRADRLVSVRHACCLVVTFLISSCCVSDVVLGAWLGGGRTWGQGGGNSRFGVWGCGFESFGVGHTPGAKGEAKTEEELTQ
jgi:hypothetical protein